MHVTIVTAGGAGMFCGSCLHDNAWARGLRAAGVDVTLLPLYTPIRVDDEDLTSTRVFYGGLNVYLDQHLPGWRYLPRWLTRPLDAPRLIDWATKFSVSNNAAELGAMTHAMLLGPAGPQAKEGAELVKFLADDLKPDLVVFSNVMLAAEITRLKSVYHGPVLCSLQGDDIFLEGLTEPWRSKVFGQLRHIVAQLDGFLLHSRFYGDFMAGYLGVPANKQHTLPLAVDVTGHDGVPRPRGTPATIGYFARLAPEKGLREFLEAAVLMNTRRQDFRVVVGGYAPPQHRAYVEQAVRQASPLGERLVMAGSPETLADKVVLLKMFDLLSVPAPYREPKGLYVLEAWANGVPVVQPAHGHFPELIEEAGGGVCVPPADPVAIATSWNELLDDEPRRRQLAEQGWSTVRTRHALPALAARTIPLFERLIAEHPTKSPRG
jgi:glycosyltransferase involved in cell wall biosynthesis